MFDFGYQLTVAARRAYTVGELDGDAARLVSCNELQHQLMGAQGSFAVVRNGLWKALLQTSGFRRMGQDVVLLPDVKQLGDSAFHR